MATKKLQIIDSIGFATTDYVDENSKIEVSNAAPTNSNIEVWIDTSEYETTSLIVDSLDSYSSTSTLSANQGRVLNEKITSLSDTLIEQIDALDTNVNELQTNCIVESATTTKDDCNWTYKKYSNGVIECWGSKDYSTILDTGIINNTYYKSTDLTVSLPVSFVSFSYIDIKPTRIAWSGSADTLIDSRILRSSVSNGTITFFVVQSTNATTSNVSVTCYFNVKGKWK